MIHFEYQIIPADQWRHRRSTIPRNGNEARPHFVPVTGQGLMFVALDALGGIAPTGYCPGEIFTDGKWVTGYRFISLSEELVPDMLADLDAQVENIGVAT